MQDASKILSTKSFLLKHLQEGIYPQQVVSTGLAEQTPSQQLQVGALGYFLVQGKQLLT